VMTVSDGIHLLHQDSHSCAIDGYDELVSILHIRIVLTLCDMDSKGCLYPSSWDNLSTDLGCVLRISFISLLSPCPQYQTHLVRDSTIGPDPVILGDRSTQIFRHPGTLERISVMDASRMSQSIVDNMKIMGHNNQLT